MAGGAESVTCPCDEPAPVLDVIPRGRAGIGAAPATPCMSIPASSALRTATQRASRRPARASHARPDWSATGPAVGAAVSARTCA